MRSAVLTSVVCLTCFNASALFEVFDSGNRADVHGAAQDDLGTIFLATSEAVRWHEWDGNPSTYLFGAGVSFDRKLGKAVMLESAGNGWIYSLWEGADEAGLMLWLFSGNQYRPRFQQIRGPPRLVSTLMDGRTNVWVVEAALNIYQTPPLRPTHRLVHTITVDQLWPGSDVTSRLPVSMVEDGRGRIWFWSNCLLGGDERGALRGVLIAQGDTVTHHLGLAGVATNRISVIAPIDRENLWIAVREAGIYSVNLDTLAGERVAEPETNAFRLVQTIISAGEDRYVISGPAGQCNERGLMSTLWRWRGGRWTRLIDGLDSDGVLERLADRRWRATKDGLWLGAFGMGGWFVPRDDSEPRQIAWQMGSPFDTIQRWFQLKNGQMLAIQFGRGGLLADAALPAGKPVSSKVEILRLERPLIQTVDGRIFASRREKEPALSEWDGAAWRRHPFPENAQMWKNAQAATDAKGRVWFMDPSWNADPKSGPTLIFNPATGQFQRLSSFASALQSQATALAGSRLMRDKSAIVAFSNDGRILLDQEWRLHYFNGLEWRDWHLDHIVTEGSWGSGKRAPYFDTDGRLALAVKDRTWQFDDLGGWKKISTPVTKASDLREESPPASVPVVPEASSMVADQRGLFWVVARKQLYRAGYGLYAAVFPPNEPQPFVDGRKLTGALVDNAGNVFLQTSLQGRAETVFVPVRGKSPDTEVILQKEAEEGVTLELSALGPQSPRFMWRLDDGPWQDAVTNSSLRFDDLPAGKHSAQVAAIDEQLLVDLSPAEVTFEVRSTPTERIAKWIRQLGDRDFSRREAAAQALSRRPGGALPELRKALQRENDRDRRWWLEAVIQQCEQARSKGAP